MSTIDEETRALLAAYAEGELDAEGCAALEARFDSEPELVEELEALTALPTNLAALSHDAAPADFAEDVAERIRRRSRGRFFAREVEGPRFSIEVVFAVAVVIFGIVWFAQRVSTVDIVSDEPLEVPAPAPEGSNPGGPRFAPEVDDGSGTGRATTGDDPDPMAGATPAPSRVSGGVYVDANRQTFRYVIQTAIEPSELAIELRRAAGASRVVEGSAEAEVYVDARDVPAMVARLQSLGTVSREVVVAHDGDVGAPIVVRAAP